MKIRLSIIYIHILLTTCIVESCDCQQRQDGVVIDKNTKKPISGVLVRKLNSSQEASGIQDYSDLNGHFELRAISGGLFGCPVMKVSYYKSGYDILVKSAPFNYVKDTIYLRVHSDTR